MHADILMPRPAEAPALPHDIDTNLRVYAHYALVSRHSIFLSWTMAAGFIAAFALARGDIDPSVEFLVTAGPCTMIDPRSRRAAGNALRAAEPLLHRLIACTTGYNTNTYYAAHITQQNQTMGRIPIRLIAAAPHLIRRLCEHFHISSYQLLADSSRINDDSGNLGLFE